MAALVKRSTRQIAVSIRTIQRPRQYSNIPRFRRSAPSSLLLPKTRLFASQAATAASNEQHATQPASLSQNEYHKLSDTYIESLVEALEEMAESKPAMDVEYHSGVLNLTFPPAGTYVINKQPPNCQIWLSSPISGPKRYDLVKNGNGSGVWTYLRDNSTLTALLNEELKLDFKPPEVD